MIVPEGPRAALTISEDTEMYRRGVLFLDLDYGGFSQAWDVFANGHYTGVQMRAGREHRNAPTVREFVVIAPVESPPMVKGNAMDREAPSFDDLFDALRAAGHNVLIG